MVLIVYPLLAGGAKHFSLVFQCAEDAQTAYFPQFVMLKGQLG
jgi:hypothetical protein